MNFQLNQRPRRKFATLGQPESRASATSLNFSFVRGVYSVHANAHSYLIKIIPPNVARHITSGPTAPANPKRPSNVRRGTN
jgi:hypothetical protein